ncbi:MAG: ATP-binding protein [Muribaculaceae bacterium]|nr:ATP-binding protein [Muribaculaceae bacterium]
MKDLRPIRGRQYILDCIAQGEHQQQDFKYAISDARKIARSISAFANCEGGHLLVGVKDSGAIAGVRNEEDVYVIEQAAQLYCRPAQEVEFTAFNTGETGIVIRARIAKSPVRAVMAQEPDLSWRAYWRVADENIAAHPLQVRAWQREADGTAETMSLDGIEMALLRHVSAQAPVPIETAIRALPCSRQTAEAAIVRLASMRLLAFSFTPSRGFSLLLPE